MASFIGFDQSSKNLIHKCVEHNNKQDVALFIMQQFKTVHELNKQQRENAKQSGDSNNSNNSSNRRQAALDRLKAHLN